MVTWLLMRVKWLHGFCCMSDGCRDFVGWMSCECIVCFFFLACLRIAFFFLHSLRLHGFIACFIVICFC